MHHERDAGGQALDARVRELVDAGDVDAAATAVLRGVGPEIYGFLSGVLDGEDDADEVFSITSERVWRSIGEFQWRCRLRTWVYVIAHRELSRFRQTARRARECRVATSELEKVVAYVRTETQSALRAEKRERLGQLRSELTLEDRTLLVMRVDRDLAFKEIALAFVDDPDTCSADDVEREADRLRKRFQIIKKRLAARAKDPDPHSDSAS